MKLDRWLFFALPPPTITMRTSALAMYHQNAMRMTTSSFLAPASCSEQTTDDTIMSSKQVFLLKQRMLSRELSRCRNDRKRALHLLGECYPHLSCIPQVVVDAIDQHESALSYEGLLKILYEVSPIQSFMNNDEVLIIDGRSITTTMEVIRKGKNVAPAALHLLKLSVDGVLCNRQIRGRSTVTPEHDPSSDNGKNPACVENSNDINELRQIYKAAISLLGHANIPSVRLDSAKSSITPRLISHILHEHIPHVANMQPEPEIYHAVLNALGRCGECNAILTILEAMEHSYDRYQSQFPTHEHASLRKNISLDAANRTITPAYYLPVDRMGYQTAITSLAKHSNVEMAISLLNRMKSRGFLPDVNCYNMVLIGIAKQAGKARSGKSIPGNVKIEWHKVALDILQEMIDQDLRPTDQAYNSVIAACGKEGAWDEARKTMKMELNFSIHALDESSFRENLMQSSDAIDVMTVIESNPSVCNVQNKDKRNVTKSHDGVSTAPNHLVEYFKDLKCYKKRGKGKDCWWEIGDYRSDTLSIIIGIQPHRNPVRNGLSIVFHDMKTGMKLGRILLKNSFSKRNGSLYSSIVGMEIDKSRRGEGLSKVLVSIWFKICLSTNAYPRAALMNKPLISLVLMQFGFVPQEGGTCVELIRLGNANEPIENIEHNPVFGLYSSNKSLQGVFSQRVLRSQNIAILNHDVPPSSRGKGTKIYIKTTFEHPIAIADNAVDYKPPVEMEQEAKDTITVGSGDCEGHGLLQRKILEGRLNDVLCGGALKFFLSSENLQRAFSRYLVY
ncbi:hypothetical protein ACHAWX_001757 [Stephanocyclus meneghinianus]